MTRKHTMQWRSGCPCCDDRVSQDRRNLMFGGAMLGVAGATGFFASAAAQVAPNPGRRPAAYCNFSARRL
jgi:hypothetical protein